MDKSIHNQVGTGHLPTSVRVSSDPIGVSTDIAPMSSEVKSEVNNNGSGQISMNSQVTSGDIVKVATSPASNPSNPHTADILSEGIPAVPDVGDPVKLKGNLGSYRAGDEGIVISNIDAIESDRGFLYIRMYDGAHRYCYPSSVELVRRKQADIISQFPEYTVVVGEVWENKLDTSFTYLILGISSAGEAAEKFHASTSALDNNSGFPDKKVVSDDDIVVQIQSLNSNRIYIERIDVFLDDYRLITPVKTSAIDNPTVDVSDVVLGEKYHTRSGLYVATPVWVGTFSEAKSMYPDVFKRNWGETHEQQLRNRQLDVDPFVVVYRMGDEDMSLYWKPVGTFLNDYPFAGKKTYHTADIISQFSPTLTWEQLKTAMQPYQLWKAVGPTIFPNSGRYLFVVDPTITEEINDFGLVGGGTDVRFGIRWGNWSKTTKPDGTFGDMGIWKSEEPYELISNDYRTMKTADILSDFINPKTLIGKKFMHDSSKATVTWQVDGVGTMGIDMANISGGTLGIDTLRALPPDTPIVIMKLVGGDLEPTVSLMYVPIYDLHTEFIPEEEWQIKYGHSKQADILSQLRPIVSFEELKTTLKPYQVWKAINPVVSRYAYLFIEDPKIVGFGLNEWFDVAKSAWSPETKTVPHTLNGARVWAKEGPFELVSDDYRTMNRTADIVGTPQPELSQEYNYHVGQSVWHKLSFGKSEILYIGTKLNAHMRYPDANTVHSTDRLFDFDIVVVIKGVNPQFADDHVHMLGLEYFSHFWLTTDPIPEYMEKLREQHRRIREIEEQGLIQGHGSKVADIISVHQPIYRFPVDTGVRAVILYEGTFHNAFRRFDDKGLKINWSGENAKTVNDDVVVAEIHGNKSTLDAFPYPPYPLMYSKTIFFRDYVLTDETELPKVNKTADIITKMNPQENQTWISVNADGEWQKVVVKDVLPYTEAHGGFSDKSWIERNQGAKYLITPSHLDMNHYDARILLKSLQAGNTDPIIVVYESHSNQEEPYWTTLDYFMSMFRLYMGKEQTKQADIIQPLSPLPLGVQWEKNGFKLELRETPHAASPFVYLVLISPEGLTDYPIYWAETETDLGPYGVSGTKYDYPERVPESLRPAINKWMKANWDRYQMTKELYKKA